MLSGAADQRTDGHKQIARKVVSGLMGAPAWNGGMPEENRRKGIIAETHASEPLFRNWRLGFGG